MKTILLIVLIHTICTIECANLTIGDIVQENETNLIQKLEKEKTEIYNELNEAVEDTIKTLEKTNDSDARQGITLMKDLMALIGDFNDTKLAKSQPVCDGTECTNKTTVLNSRDSLIFSSDGRRSHMQNHNSYDFVKSGIMKSGIFKKTDELNKNKDEKVQNMMVLEEKLGQWLKMREAERKKIKQYRERHNIEKNGMALNEECPNFGEMKGKKAGGEKSNKYPCCRKCCKKSYLGCL